MFKWIFRKRGIQKELVEIIEYEIKNLEDYLENNSFKSLLMAEKNELLARLRIIRTNVGTITLINK